MRTCWMLSLAFVLAAGCGGGKFAPVSGKVTLNSKPLANVLVSFNPIPREGSSEAGPGSIGTTNADGEFTLRVSPSQDGALVGKHRVTITPMNPQSGDSDARRSRVSGAPMKGIPSRYNDQSKMTFDVPPGGSKEANFKLESP